MKKPVYRCLTNPTNFVGTGRLTKSKYKRVVCHSCKGQGAQMFQGVPGKCWLCKGVGKISLGVES